MSEEMLDYGEMKNNLLVYKSKEQVADICIALYKEIERLNNIIDKKEQFLGDNIKRLEKEVVKRDNIINEFDKFLFGELQTYGGGGIAQEYYDKLQELKGSDKE